jgi:hypothetical protein
MLAGEAHFTTDRGTLHVATDPTTKLPVVPAIDDLTTLASVDGAADLLIIHDASQASGQKEKKITFDAFKTALNIPPGSIDESPAAVSVKNTDPTIETRPPQTTTSLEQPMPWFSRFLLRIDKHIGTVLEILIIGIILALVGLYYKSTCHHVFFLESSTLKSIVQVSPVFFCKTNNKFFYKCVSYTSVMQILFCFYTIM